MPEGFQPPEGFDPSQGFPDGMTPPEGMPDLPEGFDPDDLPEDFPGFPGQPGGDGEGERGGGGPMGRSNVLVERFQEVDEFAALLEDAEQRLKADLVDSGLAAELLEA